MREILFRGKRNANGVFVEGFLFLKQEGDEIRTCIGIDPLRDYPDGELAQGCYFEINPETVGQFTGLTDKNGKKIFEGDIGRYKQVDGAKRNGKPITCIGKVVYNVKTASFAIESKDETGCKYFDYFPIKDFEVIGNIHDNPELLELPKGE